MRSLKVPLFLQVVCATDGTHSLCRVHVTRRQAVPPREAKDGNNGVAAGHCTTVEVHVPAAIALTGHP